MPMNQTRSKSVEFAALDRTAQPSPGGQIGRETYESEDPDSESSQFRREGRS
jgi:hypothetical protein